MSDFLRCSEVGCPHVVPNHRWGKTKAAGDGWFFAKDGGVWCPVHLPEWYTAWKAKKTK